MGVGTADSGNTSYQANDLDAMIHVIMFNFTNRSDGALQTRLDWDGSTAYGDPLLNHGKHLNDYVRSKCKPIVITLFGTGGEDNFSQAIAAAAYRTTLVSRLMQFQQTEQVSSDLIPPRIKSFSCAHNV
jgi:hypothetical protein